MRCYLIKLSSLSYMASSLDVGMPICFSAQSSLGAINYNILEPQDFIAVYYESPIDKICALWQVVGGVTENSFSFTKVFEVSVGIEIDRVLKDQLDNQNIIEISEDFLKKIKKGLFCHMADLLHTENAEDRRVHQSILFGAPGTGKSFKIDDAENGYGLENINEEFKFRTTFHPDYDYAQFVGSYKPVETPNIPILNRDDLSRELRRFLAEERPNAIHKFAAYYYSSLKKLSTDEKRDLFNGGNVPETVQSAEIPKGMAAGEFIDEKKKNSSITYTFVPQTFAKAYVKAWIEYLKVHADPNAEKVYLVIEEINRGNCAQIFGDIFQLLDRKEGHSDYPIDIDSDFANYIKKQLSNVKQADDTIANYWNDYKNKIQEWDSSELDVEHADDGCCKIALPPNLNILATMNTSDQSLFPMDSAFKRRFDWEYVPIKDERDETCGTEWNADQFMIFVGNSRYNWLDFLKGANKNISFVTKSEDKQMGEFFIKPKTGNTIEFEDFRSKVLFYLWDSVYKDETDNTDAKIFKFKKTENGQEVNVKYSFQDLYKGSIDDQKNRVKDIVENAINLARQNA